MFLKLWDSHNRIPSPVFDVFTRVTLRNSSYVNVLKKIRC